MPLNSADFEYIAKLLRDRSVIVLEAGKEYLVESRLLPIARGEGFASLSDLVARLRSSLANGLQQKVIEAMITNETSFFRDLHPFDALRKTLMPELMAKRDKERKLNFWCGASSSGQEPYTVALILHEHFPTLANWTTRFIATGLSMEMVERARRAVQSAGGQPWYAGAAPGEVFSTARRRMAGQRGSAQSSRVPPDEPRRIVDANAGDGCHLHKKRAHLLRRADQESHLRQDTPYLTTGRLSVSRSGGDNVKSQ